ncbi:hypothetical protein [Methanosarcina barkeri]|uniref:DUF4760 domain-containing protein n=1 Tax=Methanosarcina barkeri CM1 TaxID=796385 RepID=A0A0G3CF12_METBA|nr:hypothetical protein [Methanosarcina barkeri]AKJ39315.1 hypothetical protein MCM1_2298 [Methanosarcina barkeri CM1]
MGTEAWTNIITALSTLFAVWITQRYEIIRRKSEEKRWYADFFLRRKIDSITNLYISLLDWHDSINFYGNLQPSTLTEFKDQVQAKEDPYLRSLAIASIYLEKDEYEVMKDVLGAFRQATKAIWLSLPDDQCSANKNSYTQEVTNLNWKNFFETHDKAVIIIKNYLNPDILIQIN